MTREPPDNYILLVEDDELNQTVIQDLFEFGDVLGELVCVSSAELAFEQIALRMPALVLMDVELLGMNGLDATRRLRRNPRTRALPIWALTAHAMKGNAEQVFAAGCTRFITKPVSGKYLAEELAQFQSQLADGKEASCLDY